MGLAEKEGFEPPVPSRVQRFSRPPHSTTLPFLRAQRYFHFFNFSIFFSVVKKKLQILSFSLAIIRFLSIN